jgi:hypothetical protein
MGIKSGFICWQRALFAPLLHPVRRFESSVASIQDEVWEKARPYSAVPGPKPLPIVGNTWRFLPLVGKMCDPVTTPLLPVSMPLDFTQARNNRLHQSIFRTHSMHELVRWKKN